MKAKKSSDNVKNLSGDPVDALVCFSGSLRRLRRHFLCGWPGTYTKIRNERWSTRDKRRLFSHLGARRSSRTCSKTPSFTTSCVMTTDNTVAIYVRILYIQRGGGGENNYCIRGVHACTQQILRIFNSTPLSTVYILN